jgi:hypothetical protein
VASGWTARGTNRGRQVTLRGITISRFEDGKIVEDWGYSDTLDLLRSARPPRLVALGAEQLIDRLLRSGISPCRRVEFGHSSLVAELVEATCFRAELSASLYGPPWAFQEASMSS